MRDRGYRRPLFIDRGARRCRARGSSQAAPSSISRRAKNRLSLNKIGGAQMSLPNVFNGRLRLPAIGAPLFIVSCPALVIAQCQAGIVGSFPALNARPASQLDEWLHEITETLAAHDRDHPRRSRRAFRRQSDRPQVQQPARRGPRAHRQMEGADRHHLARRARGPQPRRSWLRRRRDARRHQRPVRP